MQEEKLYLEPNFTDNLVFPVLPPWQTPSTYSAALGLVDNRLGGLSQESREFGRWKIVQASANQLAEICQVLGIDPEDQQVWGPLFLDQLFPEIGIGLFKSAHGMANEKREEYWQREGMKELLAAVAEVRKELDSQKAIQKLFKPLGKTVVLPDEHAYP